MTNDDPQSLPRLFTDTVIPGQIDSVFVNCRS